MAEVLTSQASEVVCMMAAAGLARLRREHPRVHCLTNTVAQPVTANLLLAAGARVSLAAHPAEAAEMAASAQGVLINLGTLDPMREAAIPMVLDAVDGARTPVVLDPVFAELSLLRRALAGHVLARGNVIVKGNAGEMAALDLAGAAVRATTGPVDIVEADGRRIRIANGHPRMTEVTGIGCAAGALIAAFAAATGDRAGGAAAALLVLGVAGEIAAGRAAGPGTFAVHLVDAMSTLDAATLQARARIT